jgi:hypothetical protein
LAGDSGVLGMQHMAVVKVFALETGIEPPGNFAAAADGGSRIDVSWDLNGAEDDVVVAWNYDGNFAAPAGGPPAVGEPFAGGWVLYAGGETNAVHDGLDGCGTYAYRAWSYVGTNYSDGVGASAATVGPEAPATVWASATNATGFVAAWSAVSGATGYRLEVSESDTFSGGGGEGTSRTNDCADVGGGTASSYVTRIWTNNGDVVWTAYKARTDQTVNDNPSVTFRNESGAYLVCESLPNGMGSLRFAVQQKFTGSGGQLAVLVDGAQIGTFAYDENVRTAVFANVNAANVASLVISNNTAARPAINDLVWTDHASDSPSYVPGYSNLAVAGTSLAVTGLTAESVYYFRVRAEDGDCVGEVSATASATTTADAPEPQDQTIEFAPIGDQVATNFVELSATASSGLPVSFAVESGPAEIAGGTTLSFTGAGLVRIVASQAGDGAWNPAPPKTNELTVAKAGAAVAIGGTLQTFDGTPKSVSASTVPAGLAVVVRYDGSATAPTAEGTYAVEAEIDEPRYAGMAAATLRIDANASAFDAWLQDVQEQSPQDAAFDWSADADGDGMNTWEEFLADTDPDDAGKVLVLDGAYSTVQDVGSATGEIRFGFPASTGRYYRLVVSTNLSVGRQVHPLGQGTPDAEGRMTVTNASPGTWYGAVEVLLEEP